MKPIHLLTALAFGLSNGAFAAGGHDHAHEHTALHGGVVASNPFERAADRYARTGRGWWPWARD